MTDRDDKINEFKRVADMLDEQMLATTILHYARRGRCTTLMVEQAIVLVEHSLDYAKSIGDQNIAAPAERLIADLRQALIDGVEALRQKEGPGPEILYVEEPLARARIARGHKIKRQHRCATGIIDIYDLTADEIIECKHRGSASAIGQAAAQLQRYRRSFPGVALTIAVTRIEEDALWLVEVFTREGITFIELDPEMGR